MNDKILQDLMRLCKKNLGSKSMKLPNVTIEQVDDNLDMISTEDEDYIMLFEGGIINKLQLIDLLLGKQSLF